MLIGDRCQVLAKQEPTEEPKRRWDRSERAHRYLSWLVWYLISNAALVVHGGPVRSLDDVQFWTGSGANRAALAVDWAGQDSQSTSLVWGFRWDGVAFGADMLQAVVDADPRLYAKAGTVGNLGLAVFGIGYDASGDGEFALDDGTVFDESGWATTGPADLAVAADSADFYREGWYLGFWHHGTSNDPAVDWMSGPGVSARTLVDGGWDSLAFTNSIFDQSSFASGLVSAERTSLIGDYNRDDIVDVADFTVWRDSLGKQVPIAGFGADGNFDGIVDDSDRIVWQESFGDTAGAEDHFAVPEPEAYSLVWLALLLLGFATWERKWTRCVSL